MASRTRVRKTPLQKRLLHEKQEAGTYLELSRRLGVSVSQLHDWASGKYEPTMVSWRRLAKVLKCSVGELMGVS